MLEQESGKALDPRVVEAFVAHHAGSCAPRSEAQTSRAPRPVAAASDSATRPRTLGAPPADRRRPSVFDDIALAHREIYALYQIAQTMGTSLGVADTMALIASKLTNLVPFSACALFLYAEATDTLDCRFATGTDSELMQQLALRTARA